MASSTLRALAVGVLLGAGATTSAAQSVGAAGAEPPSDGTTRVETPSVEAPGVVRAIDNATISSQVSATIESLPLRDGDSFAQGDLLVRFDCSRLQAEREAAQAEARAAGATYRLTKELASYEAAGRSELNVSLAELQSSQARAAALGVLVGHCQINAPFSGRVVERLANEHETMTEGQELLRIVDTSRLEIDLIVPSIWLRWLKPGTELSFEIAETGATVPARVDSLGAAIDPVSRTIKIKAGFDTPTVGILPGMSGVARFEQPDG